MTLIYAFANRWSTNISARVLLEFQQIQAGKVPCKGKGGTQYQRVLGHPKAFFQTHIHNKIYDKIIGLGDFYGNFPKIRLETIAKNQYGYKAISTNSPYQIPLNTPPLSYNPDIIISKNMGNYNCNWIAYQTQFYLNSKNLDTIHLFFHLPKKLSHTSVANQLVSFI